MKSDSDNAPDDSDLANFRDVLEYNMVFSWGNESTLEDLTEKDLDRFRAFGDPIAEKFGISNKAAHFHLIAFLWNHATEESPVDFDNGIITAYADNKNVKDTFEDHFYPLRTALRRAQKIIDDAQGERNGIILKAMWSAQPDLSKLQQEYAGFKAFAATVERASMFSGTPGRPKRPRWVETFCRTCQVFWYMYGSGGTRLNYKAPKKPMIAVWAENLFEEFQKHLVETEPQLPKERRSSISVMHKVAQELPAYRPPKTSSFGE
ncbi:hypothetical protein [Boseongicola aestuarii]|uniref:Uncharacterized protein n=1 Tax=Boseongicola aestuarii TaxID=1470561 RepID=A0A238J2W2_9RHOB|nr:hypothetical protein [Boseongicola aestuarii]SMX25038.1 hypothetical protein BOA8489_03172 [Boseongicola aestuarii]